MLTVQEEYTLLLVRRKARQSFLCMLRLQYDTGITMFELHKAVKATYGTDTFTTWVGERDACEEYRFLDEYSGPLVYVKLEKRAKKDSAVHLTTHETGLGLLSARFGSLRYHCDYHL